MDFRDCYRLQKIDFKDLKKGDLFLLTEEGNIVKSRADGVEAIVFVATGEPFSVSSGVKGNYWVNCDPARL